jgi:dissimilatory sulfite reductase (desulfoviridin) alpha/beta subunit
MGCGCAERKRRLAEWMERRGAEKLARVVRTLPTPKEVRKPPGREE